MSGKDLHHNIAVETALAPTLVQDADEVITDIDLLRFFASEIIITAAKSGDAAPVFHVKVEHKDEGGSYEPVKLTDLICVTSIGGSTPGVIDDAESIFDDGSNGTGDIGSADGAPKTYRFGYRGSKQFLQVTIVDAGTNTTGTTFTCHVLKGLPAVAPVA